MRQRLVIALLLLAAGLRADEGTAVTLSPTATPIPLVTAELTPEATAEAKVETLGHSGVVYQFSLSNWTVFNGSPLAYTPFEVGYDFGNGLRLQSGVDLFFYEGKQDDAKLAPGVLKRYSYEMQDWRSSVYYRVPTAYRLRPLAGLSIDLLGGQRHLAPDFSGPGGSDVNAKASKIPAWSFFGASASLGLEYLLSPTWALNLSGRYTATFSTVSAPLVAQCGLLVTF